MVKFRYILMLVLLNVAIAFLTIFFIGDLSQFQDIKKEKLKKVEAQVINYKEINGKSVEYEFTLQGHTCIFYMKAIRKFKYDDFEDNYKAENVYTFWVESNYDKQQWARIYEMGDNMQTYLEIRDINKSEKIDNYLAIVTCIVMCIGMLVLDISLFRIRRELI